MYTFLHPNIYVLLGIIYFMSYGIRKTAMILRIPFSIEISKCSLALFIFSYFIYNQGHMYDTANLFLHLGTIQKLILGRPQGSLGAVKNYTAF